MANYKGKFPDIGHTPHPGSKREKQFNSADLPGPRKEQRREVQWSIFYLYYK